ncbi:hypothetical protein C9374_002175 [Naegleria lovaniensis]|uniref:RCC1-like domain-containing protein n=1 Tax=Naegleria lovaniensis TaxID=51637 RepID=A0AA88GQP6_NAELO|nr:uncharacterized protein C9374_002175 [Naegleria lovaniensis]KAG2387140.1 hypothetical protein C9374_002175 [Naegleria lovaniensis]
MKQQGRPSIISLGRSGIASLLVACLFICSVLQLVRTQQLPLDEAYYKIGLYRERRDSYYSVLQDYKSQKKEMLEARTLEKISVISEAIQYSENYISQFGIPRDQYQTMLENKVKQYNNVLATVKELDSLIAFTNTGFNHTYNKLRRLVEDSVNYLNDPSKWTITNETSAPLPLVFNITHGYLRNYASYHPVVRKRNRLSAGKEHGLHLHGNGLLYSWGRHNKGSLGRSEYTQGATYGLDISKPVQLPQNLTILQFDSSYYSNIVLAYGHEVYTWGENSKGEVGDGTIEPRVVPLKVCSWDLQGPKMVEQVAAAPYVFYAIDQFGKLYAWGKNNRGQLGDRTTIDKNKPINVYMEGALLNKAVTLVCGGDLHTVVLTTDNQLYSFGDNQYGQLGLGYESAADYIMEAVPIPKPAELGDETIVDLQCGDYHTMVLTENGTVFAWGRNEKGQLGVGDTTTKSTPTKVSLTNIVGKSIVKIYSRRNVAFALTNDGKWYSWGENTNYQLGHTTRAGASGNYYQTVPSPVTDLPTDTLYNHLITEVAAMDQASVGFTTDAMIVGTGKGTIGLLPNITTDRTGFKLGWTFDANTGFSLERRHYPYFEVNDKAYQFIGEQFYPLVENGFQLHYRNLSDPYTWDLVDYNNKTKKAFPGTIYNTHVVRAQEYIYFFGGVVNGSISDKIYRAPVSDVENGWEQLKYTLPYPIASGHCVVVDDTIFIYGGIHSTDSKNYSVTNKIIRASITEPRVWTISPDVLPNQVYGGKIAQIGQYLYIFGGRSPSQEAYSDILRAPYIFPSKWENTYSVLPFTYSDGPMVVTRDYIFIFGGFASKGVPRTLNDYNPRVSFATTEDPLGSWTVSGDVLTSLSLYTPTFVGSDLYLYGTDIKRIFTRQTSPFSHTVCKIPLLNIVQSDE